MPAPHPSHPPGVVQLHPVELKIDSDPANLRDVRTAVEAYGKSAGLEQADCDALGLCVNEAMANIIRHGYGGDRHQPIVVTAERREATAGRPAEVRVGLRDWGKPFDPAALPQKDPAAAGADLTPGGLGLLCLRELMDDVVYEKLPDGMKLTLVKYIDDGEPRAGGRAAAAV